MRSVLLAVVVLLAGCCYQTVLCSRADEHLDEARRLLTQGQHNEALQALEQAVQVDPSNYLVRFKRAAIFLSMGRNPAALEDLNTIIKQKPDFDQALLQRAKLYLRECSLSSAKSDLQSLIDRSSEAQQLYKDVEETEQLLRELKQGSHSHDSILPQFQKAIEVCPQDAEIRLMRAAVYEGRKDYEMAASDYSRAATLRSNDIESHTHAARLFLKVGQLDNALSNIKSCLNYDPEHKASLKKFKTIKKLNKAIENAEKLSEKGKLLDALGGDGLGVTDKDSKSGAYRLLDELGIEAGVKIKILQMACDILTKLKRSKEAIDWCSQALELDPNDVETRCNRADAYITQESYDEAARDFTHAKENGGSSNNRVHEGMNKVQRLQRMASRKDYYKILGVPRDASDKEIKRAYRKMAIEFHPDKWQGDKAEGEKKMAEINQAYEVLSNSELRQRFDNGDDPNDPTGGQGHYGGGGFQGHPFGGGGMPFFFQSGGGGGGHGGGQHFQFHFQ